MVEDNDMLELNGTIIIKRKDFAYLFKKYFQDGTGVTSKKFEAK